MDRLADSNGRRERFPCWPFDLLGTFLPLISFPLVLALLMWKLRRHVEQRLRSPAFRTERFADQAGRQIVRRLAKCRGWLRNPIVSVLLIQYVFCPSLIAFHVAAVPALVPVFDYSRVLKNILEVEETHAFQPILSKAQYDSLPDRWLSSLHYTAVGPLARAQAASLPVIHGLVYQSTGPSVYQGVTVDCLGTGRQPYEGRCLGRDGTWYHVRVQTVGHRWGGTVALGLVLYCFLIPLQVLSAVTLCCSFWERFTRHRVVELLAASRARDDPALAERLMPMLKSDDIGLFALAFLLLPIHGLLLPFYGPAVLDGHFHWEHAHGIDDALGAR